MLNNDYSLPISFSLAAQIGLEETVLLTFLKQQAYMFNAPALRMEISHLNRQLPFWTVPILMRLLNNLQMSQLLHFKQQDQILEIQLVSKGAAGSATASAGGSIPADSVKTGPASSAQSDDRLMEKMNRLHQASREKSPSGYANGPASNSSGMNTPQTSSPQSHFTPKQQTTYPARSAARENNARSQPPVVNDRRGVTDFDLYLEQKERARQPDQWQPEEATLEQIAQSGIDREFALSLQAEFLLRIKEQRKNVRTWNSEFFKYVKRQWQYKQSDRSSYEGTSSSTKFNKTSREQVSDALSNIHDTDW